MSLRAPNRIDSAVRALVVACASIACEPELQVGTRRVDELGCAPGSSGNADLPLEEKIVELPWSTGFEDGFCDYERAGGFCYGSTGAAYEIVDAPVRSGQGAAAFSVNSNPSSDGLQTRCFLEGALPADAVYGVWFFLPALARNTGNWNLIHFRSGTLPNLLGLWDVSLANAEDGSLFLYVRDFLRDTALLPETPPEVPIGAWFHVEFRLRRAADATGEIALYQDGVLLLQATSIVTDEWAIGQWYVGNLGDALTPAESTLYVDDVTIRSP